MKWVSLLITYILILHLCEIQYYMPLLFIGFIEVNTYKRNNILIRINRIMEKLNFK